MKARIVCVKQCVNRDIEEEDSFVKRSVLRLRAHSNACKVDQQTQRLLGLNGVSK